MSENILDVEEFEKSNLRRRDLLPLWIKVFVWFFMLFGAVVPIGLVMGILGINFNLSTYGLETSHVFSLIGLLVLSIFALKGIVAFGLWTEKEWAVNLAIFDAIIGIIICVLVMLLLPNVDLNNGVSVGISLRLEIIPLIAYLIKMSKIKPEWMERIAF